MNEGPIDHLFTLPSREFVAARNALAKRLKAAGDKETAERVRRIPKPSVSAWAINQLVRKHPELVRELLEAIDTQRKLQLAGLADGKKDPQGLQEAKRAENEIIGRIERALPDILASDEHAAGRAAVERCVRSIRAAAVHPEGRALLENGHLSTDFEASGFDALGSGDQTMEALAASLSLSAPTSAAPPKLRLVPPPKQPEPPPKPTPEELRAREAEQRRILEEKRREEEARKAAEEERRRAAERAAVASALEPLRRERTRLAEQARALDVQVEKARRALEEAERRAARNRAEIEQKDAQIAQLERRLEQKPSEDE